MSGTVEGGREAAITNKKRYGEDFYKRMGSIGGKISRNGGWSGNPEAARIAGALGGKMSRKNKA